MARTLPFLLTLLLVSVPALNGTHGKDPYSHPEDLERYAEMSDSEEKLYKGMTELEDEAVTCLQWRDPANKDSGCCVDENKRTKFADVEFETDETLRTGCLDNQCRTASNWTGCQGKCAVIASCSMFNYNIGTKECSYFTTLEDTKGWVTGQADCKGREMEASVTDGSETTSCSLLLHLAISLFFTLRYSQQRGHDYRVH